jgi:hypothetical protein
MALRNTLATVSVGPAGAQGARTGGATTERDFAVFFDELIQRL